MVKTVVRQVVENVVINVVMNVVKNVVMDPANRKGSNVQSLVRGHRARRAARAAAGLVITLACPGKIFPPCLPPPYCWAGHNSGGGKASATCLPCPLPIYQACLAPPLLLGRAQAWASSRFPNSLYFPFWIKWLGGELRGLAEKSRPKIGPLGGTGKLQNRLFP